MKKIDRSKLNQATKDSLRDSKIIKISILVIGITIIFISVYLLFSYVDDKDNYYYGEWSSEINGQEKIFYDEDEYEEVNSRASIGVGIGVLLIVTAYVVDIILTRKAISNDALMKAIATNLPKEETKDTQNKDVKVVQNNKEEKKADENVVDKMKQLKQLLDDNLITQEEFDNKKKELMDTFK